MKEKFTGENVAVNEDSEFDIPNADTVYKMAKKEPNYKEQKDLKEQIKAFADDCEANPVEYIQPRHVVIEEDERCRESKRAYVPHGGAYEIPSLMINNKTVIPECGEMTFQGNADDILRTIGKLLGGRQVRLEVEWEVLG